MMAAVSLTDRTALNFFREDGYDDENQDVRLIAEAFLSFSAFGNNFIFDSSYLQSHVHITSVELHQIVLYKASHSFDWKISILNVGCTKFTQIKLLPCRERIYSSILR